tara:strand:- start:1059 stop:1808 length:750 start_codon:yes stop_codon:yes gene_type:complete
VSAIKKKKPATRSKKSSIDRSFQHQINKAKKAPNHFSEIIFLGLTKDKGFKELIKTYPDEIIDIFKVRLDVSINEFGLFLELLDENPAKLNNQLSGTLMKIGRSLLRNLKLEPKRFQNKFKKNMFTTINNAKKGHDLSIFKLVEWDKAWLATPFMQEIIILKQQYLDEGFFESLALATKKKTTGVSPKKSKNKELFLYIKLLGLIYNFKARGLLKKLHAGLIDDGYIPEDDPLLDFTIFKKYLTRDKIL